MRVTGDAGHRPAFGRGVERDGVEGDLAGVLRDGM